MAKNVHYLFVSYLRMHTKYYCICWASPASRVQGRTHNQVSLHVLSRIGIPCFPTSPSNLSHLPLSSRCLTRLCIMLPCDPVTNADEPSQPVKCQNMYLKVALFCSHCWLLCFCFLDKNFIKVLTCVKPTSLWKTYYRSASNKRPGAYLIL